MLKIRLLLVCALVAACLFGIWSWGRRVSPAQAGGWYYYVQPGDSVYLIARKVGLTVSDLDAANGYSLGTLMPNQKVFIPTVSTPVQQSYSRGSNDAELLAHLITAEATGEPYAGQVGVAAVVLNRTQNPLFPKTVSGVIYEPDAFESVSNGLIYSRPVGSQARQAAEAAIGGWDPTGGAIFFFNPSKTSSPYIWSRQILTQIGAHIFAR